MRDFSEADREQKKKERRVLPENPADLPTKKLADLEENIKSALENGYLSCPVAWSIAKREGVPKIAVGAITDKLGFRITNCQIGCFKVDKTLYSEPPKDIISEELAKTLEELDREGKLTCEKTFELAKEYNLKPMTLGNEISARGIKVHQCQLGCF